MAPPAASRPRSSRQSTLLIWLMLASPVAWLCQLQLAYTLVPWCCSHGHKWLVRLAWLPFLAVPLFAGGYALRRWWRERSASEHATVPFLAGLAVLTGGLFALAMLAQGVATFVFLPCDR